MRTSMVAGGRGLGRRLTAMSIVAATIAFAATTLVPSSAQAAGAATITGAGSGRCVDVLGGNLASGTPVALWDCNGGENQKFTATSSGQLQVLGKCLDAFGYGRGPGTKVVSWDCNGGSNQQWKASNGTFVGVDSGLCLDAIGQGTANGTRLILWYCNGQSNQSWKSTATTGGIGTPVSTSQPGSTQPGSTQPSSTQPSTAQPSSTQPGAGGSATSCGVAPVDPQATKQAKNLLCYLYSQYGNHILSGQQQDWGAENEFNYIYSKTGKYPVVRGQDIGDDKTGAKALSWWNAGGIPMVGYHMGSPARSDDTYEASQANGSIDAALTPGTSDNATLKSRLEKAAAQLKIAQDGGAAVLFRPYHEAGGTWFWWSKEGGAQYVKLWKYTFDYMTQTKGLHNLVWLMPYDGSPQASFYPGKQYVDIGGADNYAPNGDYGPMNSLYNKTKSIVGASVPIALHENGPIPDPDQLQSTGTKWVLFNTWARDTILNTNITSVAQVQKVYSSPYVVTRDEVPNLK